MKVWIQCDDCGMGGVVCETDEAIIDGQKYEDYPCKGIRKSEMKQQFGAADSEHLAKMMYSAFHGESQKREDWDDYKLMDNDYVVCEFRKMAALITNYFADGHVGEMYYSDEGDDDGE